MSGSGVKKRHQALALRAYNLSQKGLTHREIAALVEKKPEQISSLVAIGERLASLTKEPR